MNKFDFGILNICEGLETLKLSSEDKKLILLIKSQLEKDWRKPLVFLLKQLCRKYIKPNGYDDSKDVPNWYYKAIREVFNYGEEINFP